MNITQEWLGRSGVEFLFGLETTGYAHLRYYTANYGDLGTGQPIVLVPGLAGGFSLLGPLARSLSNHYRVLSYDLRGEADCFALRQRFGLGDLVEDLREFIDWHGLEKPVIFGVSFGGVIALEFAARYPGRLSHLLLQGTGAQFERGLLQKVAGLVLSQFPLPRDNPFINQFFNLLFGRKQPPGPLFEFVTRQCWQTDQSVMAHRFRLVQRYQLGPRVERIESPMLVMAGDRDLLTSERGLQALCQGASMAHRVTLPGCGHLAFLTDAKRVADEAVRFLEEHR